MVLMKKATIALGIATAALTSFVLASLPGAARADKVAPGEEVISGIVAEGVPQPRVALDRKGEGRGPFKRLAIRDVMIIDGTGAEPYGPATVIVENDRIAAILTGAAGAGAPAAAEVIDGRGNYLLPGFVDAHAHLDSTISANYGKLYEPEYVLKLWLAHGVTTAREVGTFMGLEWTLEHKRRSAAGRITAPRFVVYPLFPQLESVATPEKARQWMRAVRQKGADGVKFILSSQARETWKIPLAGKVVPISPEVHQAAIDEARKLGMGIAIHHGGTQPFNALDHARMGVDSIEHDSGIPAALTDGGKVGKDDWFTAAPRGSGKWRAVIAELVERDFTLVPTYAILEAFRDVMRASRAEWHDEYAMPALMQAFQPNTKAHASAYLDWTTTIEVRWREYFRRSMEFVNDYKNAGGRVVPGSDDGYIYQLYGFGYIRELEMLQEAGFTPLEVIRAATRNGAELVKMSNDIGTVAVGKKADLVIVPENPLANLKTLYGTGHIRYNANTGKTERVGGVRYTIRDGIVWDARALLADVRKRVADEKSKPLAAAGASAIVRPAN